MEHTMGGRYFFKWKFQPPNYFEQSILINCSDYEVTISEGQIEAIIDATKYEANPEIRAKLENTVNRSFLAVQAISHKPYELSLVEDYKLLADGRKEYHLSIHAHAMIVVGDSADLVVRDADGNIVGDTRLDRTKKKKTVTELAEKYRGNPVVINILNSNHNAVTDPENELVHLYEIRDALVNEFKGETEVKNKLGISSGDWSRFGLLANNAPVRQGRHRGKHLGMLRDATQEELDSARKFTETLFVAYLDYIEHNPQKT